jgi:hypothetical protein
MRPTHHWNVNPDRLLVSWCVAIKLSTKHGNLWHLLGILQEHVQFAVKRYIFIKCPRLVRFDHGLAISSRSIVSVRSRSHAKSQEFTKAFLVHYWTHNSFHWFWLWKAALGWCGCYRNIGFLIDRDTSGGRSGGMLSQKIFNFLRLRNAISCVLGAVQTKYQFHKQWHNDYSFIL